MNFGPPFCGHRLYVVSSVRTYCIQQHSIRRITRNVIAVSFDNEAARCRQISSRCFQGYTTKHAGIAKPRIQKERSQTLWKMMENPVVQRIVGLIGKQGKKEKDLTDYLGIAPGAMSK